jgi:hypothetical protein
LRKKCVKGREKGGKCKIKRQKRERKRETGKQKGE